MRFLQKKELKSFPGKRAKEILSIKNVFFMDE